MEDKFELFEKVSRRMTGHMRARSHSRGFWPVGKGSAGQNQELRREWLWFPSERIEAQSMRTGRTGGER